MRGSSERCAQRQQIAARGVRRCMQMAAAFMKAWAGPLWMIILLQGSGSGGERRHLVFSQFVRPGGSRMAKNGDVPVVPIEVPGNPVALRQARDSRLQENRQGPPLLSSIAVK